MDWSREDLRLGAPKPFAILSSPFDEILFLDPDVMPLRDPTFLFDTKTFKQFGALFWPDYPFTPRDSKVWELAQQPYLFEREFESGMIVLNKRNEGVLRGLQAAASLCADASFVFQYIHGDKDTFRWGFKNERVPYFLNPNYLVSVGVGVSPEFPKGNASLVINQDGRLEMESGAVFCGQNMLQMNFLDDPSAGSDRLDEFVPTPLFLHANGIKKFFRADIPPFQIAQRYQRLKVEQGGYHWIGDAFQQGHCGNLMPVDGVEIIYSS
ncbi:hypothetical protein HDU98_002116 [Podochytrium sp. JEL0797]|nr:hypothetical protein HDU98_002116 [Podochytrium sp. JEL0797]